MKEYFKKSQRLVALVLTVLMAFTMMPVNSFAATSNKGVAWDGSDRDTAQATTYTVSGTVKGSDTKAILKNATVTLKKGTKTVGSMKVTAAGTFKFTKIAKASDYKVSVAASGYTTYTSPVFAVSKSLTKNVNLASSLKVTGTIKNADGKVVSGATVSLKKGTANAVTAKTNASGVYTFSKVARGTDYTVSAAATGYKTSTAAKLTVDGNETKNITLAFATYSVTYNKNGATGTVTDTTKYRKDVSVKVKASTGLTYADHTFAGWNTKADGKGTSYAAGSSFKITGNTTLYAIWNKVEKVTVTFNANGGSAVASASVVKGAKVTKPADPTKADFTFDGWFKDEAFATAWNFDTDKATANTTLFAKWNAVAAEKFMVTFNANGGSAVTSAEVEKGAKVTKPADPTKADFTFGGWYKDEAFATAWNFDTDVVTATTTLFAKWDAAALNKPYIATAPTVATATLVYGTALSTLVFNNTPVAQISATDTTAIAGAFAWTTPTTKPTVETKTAEWTFTPTNTELYQAVTGTIAITVTKANPKVVSPAVASEVDKEAALSTSVISAGLFNDVEDKDLAGTWAWDVPTTVISASGSFDATFTPTDAANYNKATQKVDVNVKVIPIEIDSVSVTGATGVSVVLKVAEPGLVKGNFTIASTATTPVPLVITNAETADSGKTYTLSTAGMVNNTEYQVSVIKTGMTAAATKKYTYLAQAELDTTTPVSVPNPTAIVVTLKEASATKLTNADIAKFVVQFKETAPSTTADVVYIVPTALTHISGQKVVELTIPNVLAGKEGTLTVNAKPSPAVVVDFMAPTVTEAKTVRTAEDKATFKFTSSEAGTYKWLLDAVGSQAAPTTKAQLLNSATAIRGTNTLELSGLLKNTAAKLYVMYIDGAGTPNESTIQTYTVQASIQSATTSASVSTGTQVGTFKVTSAANRTYYVISDTDPALPNIGEAIPTGAISIGASADNIVGKVGQYVALYEEGVGANVGKVAAFGSVKLVLGETPNITAPTAPTVDAKFYKNGKMISGTNFIALNQTGYEMFIDKVNTKVWTANKQALTLASDQSALLPTGSVATDGDYYVYVVHTASGAWSVSATTVAVDNTAPVIKLATTNAIDRTGEKAATVKFSSSEAVMPAATAGYFFKVVQNTDSVVAAYSDPSTAGVGNPIGTANADVSVSLVTENFSTKDIEAKISILVVDRAGNTSNRIDAVIPAFVKAIPDSTEATPYIVVASASAAPAGTTGHFIHLAADGTITVKKDAAAAIPFTSTAATKAPNYDAIKAVLEKLTGTDTIVIEEGKVKAIELKLANNGKLVKEGTTFTVGDGVTLKVATSGQKLTVAGTLKIEDGGTLDTQNSGDSAVGFDALVSTIGDGGAIVVNNGGTIKASINPTGASNTVLYTFIGSGGLFNITSGSAEYKRIADAPGMTFNINGNATLTGMLDASDIDAYKGVVLTRADKVNIKNGSVVKMAVNTSLELGGTSNVTIENGGTLDLGGNGVFHHDRNAGETGKLIVKAGGVLKNSDEILIGGNDANISLTSGQIEKTVINLTDRTFISFTALKGTATIPTGKSYTVGLGETFALDKNASLVAANNFTVTGSADAPMTPTAPGVVLIYKDALLQVANKLTLGDEGQVNVFGGHLNVGSVDTAASKGTIYVSDNGKYTVGTTKVVGDSTAIWSVDPDTNSLVLGTPETLNLTVGNELRINMDTIKAPVISKWQVEIGKVTLNKPLFLASERLIKVKASAILTLNAQVTGGNGSMIELVDTATSKITGAGANNFYIGANRIATPAAAYITGGAASTVFTYCDVDGSEGTGTDYGFSKPAPAPAR